MKEAAELKDPTDHYHAQPLEVCFSIRLQVVELGCVINRYSKFSIYLCI